MTMSSNTKIFTPFDNPERQFHTRKNTTPFSVHNIYSFYESESSKSEPESEEMGVIDIETLTLEQYLALERGNTIRKEQNPEDENYEIKGQFLRELRDNTFARNESEDAFEHLRKIQEIAREIHNFRKDEGESLYHAWERYNDLLFNCPSHDLNECQKVNTFYSGIRYHTRQTLGSHGLIPGLTATKALESIQKMVDHSHKWHNKDNECAMKLEPSHDIPFMKVETFAKKVKRRIMEDNENREKFLRKLESELVNTPLVNVIRKHKTTPDAYKNWSPTKKIEELSMEQALVSMHSPKGIVENVLVKIHNFIFPVDFVLLDIIEDDKVTIILGRPMLATTHAKIDVFRKKISLEVGTEQIVFNANEGTRSLTVSPVCIINDYQVIDDLGDPKCLEEDF
ncbi:reverse transcriptase domain-containing protein [Tanacetum coccineum]